MQDCPWVQCVQAVMGYLSSGGWYITLTGVSVTADAVQVSQDSFYLALSSVHVWSQYQWIWLYCLKAPFSVPAARVAGHLLHIEPCIPVVVVERHGVTSGDLLLQVCT